MPSRFLALALAASPAAAVADEPRALDGTLLAQVTIHERIIIRIPRVARPQATIARARTAAVPVEWDEKKAPQCVPVARLAAAAFTRDGDVDLLMIDGGRMRAKLDDDCPSLDFYSGFYLKKTSDGNLCAKRDSLRARSGRSCPVGKIRRLEAKRAKP